MRKLFAAIAAPLVLLIRPLPAAELHMAVAANFVGTLQQLAPVFEQASAHRLIISPGSSGQLYAQIRQGAPFDVFLSADAEKPLLLERDGLTVPGSRFTYAIGALVLWSSRPGLIDPAGHVLQEQPPRLIGLANPQTAPYGTAAQQVLRKLALWDELNQQHRIVIGENITQTWQFAATGNVDLAFVALSQVLGPDGTISGSSWVVPTSMYQPIEQAAVVLESTRQQAAAEAFMSWLRSDPKALAMIRSAGYRTVN
ncbi:MAG: molybdate ABC transporter substrate-binding protein [Steroidobacterales bacterium]